ncbi:MAG: hypothetical protein ACR2IT_09435 [Pirellulales bacterium]
MSQSLIDTCLAALGAPPDGGLPGLLSRTTLDRFELLQTPGLWGHDPADNSYWLPTGGAAAPIPAASRRLLAALEDAIAEAESLVDIASLEPFASGEFAAAIRRGLARAASRGQPLTIRILYGRHRFVQQTDADFEASIRDLAADIPHAADIRLHACRMETSNHPASPSWNHAKIVAADGRRVILGGHNLWHADYLAFAPVHDVSALIDGQAAGEAHAFLDHLWAWVGRQLASPSAEGSVTSIRWTQGRIEPAGPPAAAVRDAMPVGRIPALAIGRLGSGVLSDPRLANVAAAVAAIAFRKARESIRISQMDFGFHWDGVNFWSADVDAALADVVTDPARRVEVMLVLSEPGAKAASGAPYSFGTTIADIVAEMRRVIGDRPVTGRMQIAPLRFSSRGDRWARNGVELKIINHAKVWIVDDRAFHVGSDNLYPHNLQEFGTLIESDELTRRFVADYWAPLWSFSSRAAVTV